MNPPKYRRCQESIPGQHTLRQTCEGLLASITPTWSSGGVAKHTSAKHHNIIFGGDVIHDEGRKEKYSSRLEELQKDEQQKYTESKEKEEEGKGSGETVR